MLKFALLPLLACLLALAACNPATPTAPPPTPNIAATVTAGIAGTRAAEAAMAATIEARVAATVTAPRPTAIAWPTATPWPTAAPRPTEIPWPTATAAPWIPTATPRPTRRPTATPRPTPTPRPTLTAAQLASPLVRYAAEHAGGPGAIYIGDGNFEALVGPTVYPEFGDDDGNVPLYAIEQHQWIFESDYYQELIEKARLTNPTPLTTHGKRITLQHVCISRMLTPCRHMETYFVPNVLERTNGQVEIEISSFVELGLHLVDTMQLMAFGTLHMMEIADGYSDYEYPIFGIRYLWGLWPNRQTHYAVQTKIFDDLEQVIEEATGAQILFNNWVSGNDNFIFSRYRLENPDDFQNLMTRSYSSALSDWLNYMGADARFIEYAEVYTSLERGIMDAAVTGANPGFWQRWYEVADYMSGPLYNFNSTASAINKEVWESIPADLQQILIEEGAKHELEALRLAAIQNSIALQRNIDAGLEFVEFGPEMRQASFEAARDSVVPYWLRRIGYPDEGQDTVAVFNDKVGPVVGLRVEPDGSVVEIPITQGPHAGKTAAEVLGRR